MISTPFNWASRQLGQTARNLGASRSMIGKGLALGVFSPLSFGTRWAGASALRSSGAWGAGAGALYGGLSSDPESSALGGAVTGAALGMGMYGGYRGARWVGGSYLRNRGGQKLAVTAANPSATHAPIIPLKTAVPQTFRDLAEDSKQFLGAKLNGLKQLPGNVSRAFRTGHAEG